MARIITDERRINFICGEISFKPDTVYEFTKMMYNKHVRQGFGERIIGNIKFSDVKLFYQQLVFEDGIQPNTVATIHSCLHPAF